MKNLKNDIRIVCIIALVMGAFSWLGYVIWDEIKPPEPPSDNDYLIITDDMIIEEEIREPIPQWFIDDFYSTFMGSELINIGGTDTLNFVIITSDKRFHDLRMAIDMDNRKGIGAIGDDMRIHVTDWKYIDPDHITTDIPTKLKEKPKDEAPND